MRLAVIIERTGPGHDELRLHLRGDLERGVRRERRLVLLGRADLDGQRARLGPARRSGAPGLAAVGRILDGVALAVLNRGRHGVLGAVLGERTGALHDELRLGLRRHLQCHRLLQFRLLRLGRPDLDGQLAHLGQARRSLAPLLAAVGGILDLVALAVFNGGRHGMRLAVILERAGALHDELRLHLRGDLERGVRRERRLAFLGRLDLDGQLAHLGQARLRLAPLAIVDLVFDLVARAVLDRGRHGALGAVLGERAGALHDERGHEQREVFAHHIAFLAFLATFGFICNLVIFALGTQIWYDGVGRHGADLVLERCAVCFVHRNFSAAGVLGELHVRLGCAGHGQHGQHHGERQQQAQQSPTFHLHAPP